MEVTGNAERGVPALGSDASWSPDGRILVFARWRSLPGGPRIPGLFSVGVDSTGLVRIIRGGRMPQWQPTS